MGKERQVVVQDQNQPAGAGSPLDIVQGCREDEEHGTLEEQEPPDIHVLQAKERGMKVAFDHMSWLNSRFSFSIVIDEGLGNERFQNQGLLAIKYDGWAEEDELEFDAFENLVTSSPKSQRKREREEVKKSEDIGEVNENNDDHEESIILFNSSDIVIGEEIEISEGGNLEKKVKYDEGFEGAADIPSVAEGRPESLPLVNNLHMCKVCDFGTEDLNELKHHLETFHDGAFWYCIKCRIYSATKGDLRLHVDHKEFLYKF